MNGLAASTNCRKYGSVALWQQESRVLQESISGISWSGGLSLGKKTCFPRSLSFRSRKLNRKSLNVKATWLFNQRKGEMDASSERSENVNEDILMFFFQLDLQTRIQVRRLFFPTDLEEFAAEETLNHLLSTLQYAMNLEQYDVAQQLRNKLSEVGSGDRLQGF